jgi:cytochrome c biogenesis protein CcmG/thiol:disulfide interchange protein DsbE
MSYLPCIVALSLLIGPQASAADQSIAPDWSLKTPDGATVQLSTEAKQQTTVLFFWATWCPYCKALMPQLQSMRIEYGDDIKILAINVFDDGDPAEFLRREGYDFTLLLDGNEVANTYNLFGTPGVLVVGRDREIFFDLQQLPPPVKRMSSEQASNSKKAAYLAPYWAAAIRQAIDLAQRNSR